MPLPSAHDKIGQYEVLNSEAQELYAFNRYGQHISTKNIVTNAYTYNFTYSVNSYYGKLTTFVDGSGIPINIVWDYRLQVGLRFTYIIKLIILINKLLTFGSE